MDAILGQTMRTPINLEHFHSSFQKLLQHPYTIPTTNINIAENMNLLNDNEKLNTIMENVSLDHLKDPTDSRVADFIPGVSEVQRKASNVTDPSSIKLKTFQTLLKHKTSKRPTAFMRTRESFTMKKFCASGTETLESLKPGEEILIYVRFYRPTRATHIGRSIEKPVFSQEIICLGRNFLSELRDKVYCVCNNYRFFDISEDPHVPLPTKDADPGFFFISDTFYNDMRNPKNMDYSQTIRNWAKTAKGLSSLEFKVAKLEETRFRDLTISLGFPQLYQHHGNCEHVFVFSNIEIVTNPGVQLLPSLSAYPFVSSVSIHNQRTCNICGRMNYVFVVEGSNRQLEDPAYLCKQCFISYHYVDGKKIGEFHAYRLNDELKTPLELDNSGEEISEDDSYRNNDITNDSENFEVYDIIIKEETNCNYND